MTIFFSPFKRSHIYSGTKYSVAVFQPTGFQLPQLPFLAPMAADKTRIQILDNSPEAIINFKQALLAAYKSRWQIINNWLKTLNNQNDIVLCCWCPYSSIAINQIKQHNFFLCHMGIIAQLLEQHRNDLSIVMDPKYQKLYQDWQPNALRQIYEDISF